MVAEYKNIFFGNHFLSMLIKNDISVLFDTQNVQ